MKKVPFQSVRSFSTVFSIFFWLSLLSIFFLPLAPLTHSGLYTAHDIWHQVARLYHYHQALADGQVLPLWIGQLAEGHGYPLFIFSYHWPWWVAEVAVQLGASYFTALKISMAAAFVLAGLSMYWCCWQVTRHRLASAVGATLYVWAPYHFLTLYVSAAVGSLWIYAITPLLFLGTWLIATNRYKPGVLLLSLTFSIGILSHVMSMIMLVPFLALWWLGCTTQRSLPKLVSQVGWLLLAGALTLLLCLWYLVPLWSYYPAIEASADSKLRQLYQSSLVTLPQLIYSPWGFGPITEHAKNGEVSFQVGVAQWLGILLALAVLLVNVVSRLSGALIAAVSRITMPPGFKLKTTKELLLLLFTAVILFSLSILLMIEPSDPAWKIITKFMAVDYPFRLLVVAVWAGSLAAALSLAALAQTLKPHFIIIITCLFIITALYTNRNHIRVNQYTDIPLSLYLSSETTTNTFHEYLPLGAPLPRPANNNPVVLPPALSPSELRQFSAPTLTNPLLTQPTRTQPTSSTSTQSGVTNLTQTTTQLSFQTTTTQSAVVAFRHLVFPQVQLTIDGKLTKYVPDNNKLMVAPLPQGQHQAIISYIRPWWLRWLNLTSLLTAVALLSLSLKHAKKIS